MVNKLRRLKAKGNSSIYSIILHYSIVLVIAVLILAVVLAVCTFFLMPEKVEPAGIRRLIRQVNNVSGDDYSSINTGRSLGKDGYFEITDSRARVIYTSDSDRKNTYNKDILQYLPMADANVVYDMIRLEQKENDGFLLVRHNNDEVTGIAVVNGKGRILFSNMKLKNSSISSETMNYLFYQVDSSNLFIQKYEFTNSAGSKRFLLIHSNSYENGFIRTQRIIVMSAVILYIILMALIIMLSGRKLSSRVVSPIKKLSRAIEGTSRGSWIQISEGEEPKEMIEVIRSFNEMEDALRKGQEEETRLVDQRRKIVADISHDLKTPVTVISGYINAMNDGLIPEEERPKYMEIIREKAELITELVNSISDFSRLDHPEFELDKRRGDLCEFIRENVAARYSELEIAGFKLDADLPDKKVMAVFDRMQLKRVFENILGNSLKYAAAPDTIFIHASVVTKKQDRYMEIRIGDNGPGIPEEYRDSVFEPFVVGDESRTSGRGTGLGLSIAKQVVELHGGSICLLDEPGTVFRILLPVI